MTDTTPAPPPFATPAQPKRPISTLAVIAFILAAATAFAFMSVKIVDVSLVAVNTPTSNTVATVFGVLGLLSILLIAANIVLAHLALRKSQAHYRARVLAAVALGVGYLFFALWVNRIIVSIIAVVVAPSGGNLVQDNFYWL